MTIDTSSYLELEKLRRTSDSQARWLRRYADLARHVAQWSKDPSTKVGAVLVGENRKQIALGYNGFPPGIADTEERLRDRPTKYRYMQHAERNVLDNAAFDARGSTLVVTMHPCVECAKSIVARGVRAVLVCDSPVPERWAESAQWARKILEEAGVLILQDQG